MLYVGVDAHRKRSRVAVMDGNGGLLKNVEVSSTRAGFTEALGRYRRPMKAVVEASYDWEPVYDWLDELAEEVVLAHPLKVRPIADARIKTDKIDAEILAHLLRADLIPEAYVPEQETRVVKRALRQRRFQVQVRGMVKNRISAPLSRNSVERPKVSDLFGTRGQAFLAAVELPETSSKRSYTSNTTTIWAFQMTLLKNSLRKDGCSSCRSSRSSTGTASTDSTTSRMCSTSNSSLLWM